MSRPPIYPFTAIVEQDEMRLALLLHAVNPRLGGVLIRGEKGTAKSTAVRALAQLLPQVKAVRGCSFGCDPEQDAVLCENCRDRVAKGEVLDVIARSIPIVDLPLGATEDRVLGSLDLERAIQKGERRFEPGLLAQANGGILYVDEVNLLEDHLVDVILDAAAMGRNYVEREGVSFSHPASFMLIGTMNPEEGDLRPQLLDRFALAVEVKGLSDPGCRAEVIRRRIAYEANPAAFIESQTEPERLERERLARARELLPSVVIDDWALDLITQICVAFGVDGLRGDLAMYRAAAALAAYHARSRVESADIRTAARLALAHRQRRQPFEEPGLDQNRLDELIDGANSRPSGEPNSSGRPPGASNDRAQGGKALGSQPPELPAGQQKMTNSADSVIPPGAPLAASLPAGPRRRFSKASDGKRSASGNERSGGIYRTAKATSGRFELALADTLRAAAPHQQARGRRQDEPLRLEPGDLKQRLRRGRSGELVLFLIDASGSMGAQRRMAAAKSAVLGLLLDAYRKRDRVAMIGFRDETATLLLPPTNSVELAERRLRKLPLGGRTPLARGLELARETIDRALRQDPTRLPLLALISDGKANVGLRGLPAWPATMREARGIRSRGWPVLLLDSSSDREGSGLARSLATELSAQRLPLAALSISGAGHAGRLAKMSAGAVRSSD
jgi:magnesium chelatase subunit D